MPTEQVKKLIKNAVGKKKQIITGTKMSMNLESLATQEIGVVINGYIYPIIKPMESTWSLLKSATTQNNKPFFKAVIKAVTAVKGGENRFEAYQRVLLEEFNVAPLASEFAFFYANIQVKEKGVNMKLGGDRNLYRKQKIDQYFAEGVVPLPPAPAKVKQGTEQKMKKQEETKQQELTVDAKGFVMENMFDGSDDEDDDEASGDDVMNDDEDEGKREDAPLPQKKLRKQKSKPPQVKQVPPPPPLSELPFSERPRTFDPTKYESDGLKFEVIKGKAIRVSKLQRGEFGYVFRNLIFPMWKKDIVGSASNSWSMVESRMLNQEQELFRRMNKLNNADALSLYFKFYEDLYLIPTEVIARGLELANNKFTQDLVDGINNRADRNGISTAEGYNINFKKGEGNEGIFQTLKGFFKLDIDSRKIKKTRDSLADEEFEKLQYTPEELKRLFANVDFFSPGKGSKITYQELGENIQVERELANPSLTRVDEDGNIIPPPPPLPPQAQAGIQAGAVPQAQAGIQAQPQAQAGAVPQVNVPQNNNVNDIQMDITEEGANVGNRQKALDEAKTDEATQQKMDNIPDLSQYGFQIAIQNVFIKYNKDFSFIKNLVEQNGALKPKEGSIKQQIDLCYAYYSSLFPLPPNDGKDSYGKALELATLKFQYKRNVEMENAWKRNLGNLSGQGGGANMGIIVSTQGLGMSASQLFNQQQPANAPQAPQAGIQAPLGNAQQAQAGAVPQAPATAQIPQQQGVAPEGLNTKTPDIQKEYKPKPEEAKPKGKKGASKKSMKQRNVVLNVREKKLNPNLLFTKLNSKNPLPEPVGDLPSFRRRNKDKERIRL